MFFQFYHASLIDPIFLKNGDDGSLYCRLESVTRRARGLRCEKGLGIYIQVNIVVRLEAVELHMVLEAICWPQRYQGIVPSGNRRWTGRCALSRS